MKFAFLGLWLTSALAPFFTHADLSEFRIAAYDSLLAKKGALTLIIPLFEKECGCTVRTLPSSDGGQLVSRMEMDLKRGKPSVHVAVGADQVLWGRAQKTAASWGKWTPKGWSDIQADLKTGSGFLPFDQGVFAWMADTQELSKKGLVAPIRLKDLLASEWKRNLILEDPRTSTPGLSFVLFTHQVLPEAEWRKFWQQFRHQWLTLAPGWNAAYGLFLKSEAPLVWSYLTSQAYHREHGDAAHRYQALVLAEGSPVQVEGAWIIQGAAKTDRELQLSRQFLEFLIRPDIQSQIAHHQWMLPVLKQAVPLPDGFAQLPQPKKRILLKATAPQVEYILSQWSELISDPAVALQP